MGFCCSKHKPVEMERKVKANNPAFNVSFHYADNRISTSRYTILTFLPKNLFEQFHRLANIYFLILLILQLIPQISPLTPITTLLPLIAVLAGSAIKDAIEDFRRHQNDRVINNRLTSILVRRQFRKERWCGAGVGDIVLLKDGDSVPADMVLLSTSEPDGLCYVQTDELDGEMNLKIRQALPVTANLTVVEHLLKFDGMVICEPPNNRLNKFEGVLVWKGQTYSLDNDRLLLRGSLLENTAFCFGLVVFAGNETKLMMNSGKTLFKRTNIDRLLNKLVAGIIIFLIFLCSLCAILCGVFESIIGDKFQVYLPWDDYIPGSVLGHSHSHDDIAGGSAVIAILTFMSYIVVLNTVVPISLYVSVEIIRFFQSCWINWDVRMYCELTDTPAKARTMMLSEQLGQIEYIFSDKTGTLTQNVMTFMKCSINGVMYGGQTVDPVGNLKISESERTNLDFKFSDPRLMKDIKNGDTHVHAFFRVMALCHSVMAEEKEGALKYFSQSPDEKALVEASRSLGFSFKSRSPTSIKIEVLGDVEVYELLCVLMFSSERKRFSVIVQREGHITLLCKGADSVICPRLSNECAELKATTMRHLHEMARNGLRILCCAYKNISDTYFEEWKIRHHVANSAVGNRDAMLDALYEEIETDLMLIGASVVEDKLQTGVPDAITKLTLANIKIWVLTGDKRETAENIGYSCNLFREDMEMLVVDAETTQGVKMQLLEAHTAIAASFPDGKIDTLSGQACDLTTKRQRAARLITPAVSFQMETRSAVARHAEHGSFALIISGHSLVHAIDPTNEEILVDVACACCSVLCCRVAPLQKAQIVELVQRRKKCLTLAIGDGANDISMIKMAHIGVGISGQEGNQAVLASDFALARFAFLERLLLVHGRWSYLRMCKFLQYFFYKNFAFTLCHFWYAFFCGFSAQTVYDDLFITLYNVVFTTLPALLLSIFEQDVSDEDSTHFPKLYTPGHCNLLFNKRIFLQCVIEGIISSLVIFFVPYFAFDHAIKSNGQGIDGLTAFNLVTASSLVVTVTLRCGICMSYWTIVHHKVIWTGILIFFGITFLCYCEPLGYWSFYGTDTNVMSTAPFWFTLVLTFTILLVPVFCYHMYWNMVRPSLADRIRIQRKRN